MKSREKSKKFGWMFSYLAYDYFKHYIQSANTFTSIINSKLKCKTSYRQLISKLNKTLNTVQINQCSKQWSKIDFEKVTSASLYKNNKSFKLLTERGERGENLSTLQLSKRSLQPGAAASSAPSPPPSHSRRVTTE